MNSQLVLMAFLFGTSLVAASPRIRSEGQPRDRLGSSTTSFDKDDKGYKIVIKLEDAFGKVADDFELMREVNVDVKLIKTLLETIVPDIRQIKSQYPELRNSTSNREDYSRNYYPQQSLPSASRLVSDNLTASTKSGWKSSCAEWRLRGERKTAVYQIQPEGVDKQVQVVCDMETDGGGWTVIQRRGVADVPKRYRENFYRNWNDYVTGFGNAYSDYWIGLDTMFNLQDKCNQELLINLTKWDGTTKYAKYGIFTISDYSDFYRLTVGNYTGTAGDALLHHNKMRFTTYDKQNDLNADDNCAELYHGAWWFKDCFWSNLNGEYAEDGMKGNMDTRQGIEWGSDHFYSYKKTEMKIRPKC